jgi:hypothetical protein
MDLEPRDSNDQRCYPHPVGKRRAEHPVENGSFIGPATRLLNPIGCVSVAI